MQQHNNKNILRRLESLSRDELFDVLHEAGIYFIDSSRDKISKEELLLVADEADEKDLLSILDLRDDVNI